MGKQYTCGIHEIINKENNKIYIGSSKHIEKRWEEHINQLNSKKHPNKFLQNEWIKFGKDAFDFKIVEVCGLDERFDREQVYIDQLKPYYRNGKGYNICENSHEQNTNDIRLFKKRHRMRNPFYKFKDRDIASQYNLSLNYVKNMHINYKDKYVWVDNDCNSCYVNVIENGVYKFDADEIDNLTREDILDACMGISAYNDICEYMIETDQNCDDEWDYTNQFGIYDTNDYIMDVLGYDIRGERWH